MNETRSRSNTEVFKKNTPIESIGDFSIFFINNNSGSIENLIDQN
ncbi:hypothetical protein GJA_3917 [Janthinobacterium agaricidamnosum NBRC 102515 = DSM 9628]|uniref:Uncharacterized protein n=1 Tax=Janthinobacterium agaricidamnosum NBRC 102515 = DSM 9628 TaxID=1349767 RepID=W0VAZ6_9BURK|nr:hypothetical protein GJA_3917 [Janthinobacterium agaricidamnosum NBRC 102515 = DSM 9628]